MVPSSANITSEKKNLEYLKRLSKLEWKVLNEKMEIVLNSYIISSLNDKNDGSHDKELISGDLPKRFH
jgi:hypothetical protein